MNNALLYIVASLVLVLTLVYFLAVIKYYIKQIVEVNRMKTLIEEIQKEYNLEINKLFSRYEQGDIDYEQLGEKEFFITNLYTKMFSDLEERFIKKYNKERIRLK